MKRVLSVGAVVLATWIFAVGSASGSVRVGHREVAGAGSTSAHNVAPPRASASAVVDSDAITFDEFGLGTTITDDYADRGVVFTSDVFTTTDGSNATAPVLSGTPKFYGDIAGRFTVPGTNTPTTVNGFSLDVGYIDNRDSVEVQYFDASGHLAGSTRAQSYGINRINVTYRGVASFTVRAVEYEAAGFAIDNLVVGTGAPGAQILRMAELGDSYSSGEGVGREKGLHYDCGTDLPEGLYIEGTTQRPAIFGVPWEKGSCQTATGSTQRPSDLAKRPALKYKNMCHRSGRAYPNQIRERLGVQAANSIFVACSGARTINIGAGSASEARFPDSPPGVHGGQTQLQTVKDFAAGGAPELITVGIGGNDANFSGIVKECIVHTCTDPDFASRTVSTINGSMFRNVRDTFKGLRSAFPGATIVAFGYPSVIDDPAQACVFRIGSDEMSWIKGTVLPGINDAIKDAASEAGVVYADITAATAGHGVCSSEPWINGLQLNSGAFHPSSKAHDAIASYFIDHYTDGSGHLLVRNPDPSAPIRQPTGPEIRLGDIDVGAGQQCGTDCLQPAACVQSCKIDVQGLGFDPGVTMSVTLESDPVVLGQVATDSTGKIDAWFTLPAKLERGLHSLTLDGIAGDGTREHAVQEFQVFGRVAPRFATSFTPGKTGTTVRMLTVKRVPAGTRVDVACARGPKGVARVLAVGHVKRHGGCPFAHRAFRIRKHAGKGRQRAVPVRGQRGAKKHGGAGAHGQFAGYFKQSLKPGIVIRLVITHPGWAGRAVDFRIRAGDRPKVTRHCTEPGLRVAGRC